MTTTEPTPPGPPGRLLHPVADAWGALAMSKATFYRECAAGRLRVVKIRSRSYVLDDELRAYVRELAAI